MPAKKNNNLENYERMSTPPKEAVQKITGGSKGAANLSSIKAQWRIKMLTDVYGEYGEGWYFDEIESEPFAIPETGIMEIFTTCKLYVRDKETGEWRPPAIGKGQCHLVSKTRNGLFVDDEARKKALTDAFGNAAKYYGVGATVYMGESIEVDSKYASPTERQMESVVPPKKKIKPISPKLKNDEVITQEQADHMESVLDSHHKSFSKVINYINGKPGRKDNPVDELNQLTYGEYADVIGVFDE